MSILLTKDTKVIVQGITGREGQFHTEQMIKYGTQVVAGGTPGKGGAETGCDYPLPETQDRSATGQKAARTTAAGECVV